MTTNHNPFTVKPNVDPYNGQPLPGFRIHGHCHHLAPGASMVHATAEGAEAWTTQHVARYHNPQVTITASTRFAAHAFVNSLDPTLRGIASRPSYVESFPASYTPELVQFAEALLYRMARIGGSMAIFSGELWDDLTDFDALATAHLQAPVTA